MEIPEIETARLRLRGHRVDDLDASLAMWSDPIVVRHIGGKTFTREEVWSRLLRYIGHWALNGFGFWLVEERDGGAFVGEVGVADFKRALEPALAAPEVGWVLAPHAHGKGYATEAVQAAMAWARPRVGERLCCIIDTGNTASMRVAEKCGFRETRRATYHGDETIVFTA